MATASRSASTSSSRAAFALCATALVAMLAAPAAAGPRLADFRGHLALGYAKLMNENAPGGSLAIGAGLEYPFRPNLSAGIDVGFSLLGSRLYERGSITADLDFSLFETLLLLHWTPPRGPVARVSVGPGLLHARAGLSTLGPGAFQDLPVEETAPGMGIGIGFGPRGESLVKAGFDLATRVAWLEEGTWTVALGRFTVHY